MYQSVNDSNYHISEKSLKNNLKRNYGNQVLLILQRILMKQLKMLNEKFSLIVSLLENQIETNQSCKTGHNLSPITKKIKKMLFKYIFKLT